MVIMYHIISSFEKNINDAVDPDINLMCLFTQMWTFVMLFLFDIIIILCLFNHSISVKHCLQVQQQTHPHPRKVQTASVS